MTDAAAPIRDAPARRDTGVRVADVLVPVAVDIAYSYRVPADMSVAPGDFVSVPLGTREVGGIVWETSTLPPGGGSNLKAINAKRDLPNLAEPLRRFVDWIPQ